MRILLVAINAKYIHSNLAVYSLRASAGKYQEQVEQAEYTINHLADEIFASIYRKKPELLLFSCYIWNREEVLRTADTVKKVLPHTVIWAGGPEVSYDGEAFLRENPAFDGVMEGEGETTFLRLLEYYVDGTGALEEIPGIVWREAAPAECPAGADGKQMAECPAEADRMIGSGSAGYDRKKTDGTIRKNPPVPVCTTLDALPFVYREPEKFENRIIYYETSRGCPFSCSYCLSSIDKRVRFRSLELVKQELSIFLEHKVKQVKFVDRTFNCSHSHAMAIWKYLLEHDNGVTNFHFEIGADLLNEEELSLLARMRPGLVQLEIGVQTVNADALRAIHRTADTERIFGRVRQVKKAHNIRQHLDLIAGLPFEDFESFRASFDAVYRLHPQELQLGFLKVLKGSEMHRRAGEYGIVYRSTPPYEVLETKWITCSELLRLKEIEEMLEVYYNSQQYGCGILAAEMLFDRPIQLYEALADHYREAGLEGLSLSRQQRMTVLKEFLENRRAGLEQKGKKVAQTWEAELEKKREEVARTGEAELEQKREKVVRTETADLEQSENPERTKAAESEGQDRKIPDDRCFRDLLTVDLYLRENAKSRSVWAQDTADQKEAVIRFYQEEERNHRYLPDLKEMTWKQQMRMTHLERFPEAILPYLPEHLKDRRGEREAWNTGPGQRYIWLLFYYGWRDPLSGSASVSIVPVSESAADEGNAD